MNIALIAHNSKKELMIQFCTAYCNIFKKHTLLATATTGRLISEATGLRIHCCLPGSHGGMEQIMARIACDEVDLLLFFRDPLRAGPDEPSSIDILRLCDVHTVPVATNIATAEALVHGLERGDLAWREYLHE